MRAVLVFLLCTLFQNTYPAPGPGRRAVSSCIPPTMTNRWQVNDGTTLCGAGPGSACLNGNNIFSVGDLADSNILVTAGQTPIIYTTSAVHGLAAGTLTQASQNAININSSIASSGALTLYAVLQPSAYTATDVIIGNDSGSPHGSFIWLIDTSGHQIIASAGSPAIGTGSSSISVIQFSLIVTTFDFSTGAWTLWNCAAGTCTSDGSAGSSGETFGNSMTTIGRDHVDNLFFGGQIAEIGYLNSVVNPNTAGIATYANCAYGI